MTQVNSTAPILKRTSEELPLSSKRNEVFSTRRTAGINALPPSLRILPTISSASQMRNSNCNIEFNEKVLDEWLERLDRVTKGTSPTTLSSSSSSSLSLEEEQNIRGIQRSMSNVTSATTSVDSSSASLSSVAERISPTDHGNSVAASQHEQRPAKRRRFARRNSFLVKDLAQLSRLDKM